MSRATIDSTGPLYCDYQASTPLDHRIAQALPGYFSTYIANPHADDHSLGWIAAEACETAAGRIASAIGCDAAEIIFTSGATEANSLALIGLAARRSPDRKRILVSATEHASVIEAARTAAQLFGCSMQIVPVDRDGVIDLDELERFLGDDVLAVSAMAANNEIGTIQPSQAISRLCERVGAVFHCDAVQAHTAFPLNVESLGAHCVSLSAHKIYGPKGIGSLFVSHAIQRQIEPLIVGGGQQGGLRAGTLPTPLCIAFADAVELMNGETAVAERRRVAQLRNEFVKRLLAIPGIHLNGPELGRRHPGNCNIRIDGVDAKSLLAKAQPRLAASTASACASGTPEASHVLRAIGLSEREAESSIRFSFGRFSSLAEIEQASDYVISLLGEARTENPASE
jgi:cysteine desulfurase